MKPGRRDSLIVLLALAATLGLWLVDVSVIHWLNPILGPPSNGFFTIPADKLYHLGLYLNLATVWIILLVKRG